MADLSRLFGAPQQQQRRNVFDLASPKANQFKRQIVMKEAMEQDLAPDDGIDFFKFVGNRLFELGDTEGAMAVSQQAQQLSAGQAQAEAQARQQQFDNSVTLEKLDTQSSQFNQSLGFQREKQADLSKASAKKLAQDASLGAARINASMMGLKETKRKNAASEALARDRLEFDRASDEADRLMKTLEGGGIDLSEAEGKSLSLAAQIAPAMELLNSPELTNHTPSKAAIGVIQQLASSSGDFMSSARKLFSSGVYAGLSENDKRYISHGLTVADMSLRDRTGATMNAGEVAGEFIRLLPQPGDSDRLISEKRQSRETVLDSIMVKVPDAAFTRLEEISARAQ